MTGTQTAPAAALRPSRSGPAARRWLWWPAALALLATAAVNAPVLAHATRRVAATSDDSSLFMWWLGNAAVVLRGAAPPGTGLLHTTLMNVPDGVNGAWNTSVLGLALPAVPLTLAIGPIATYNVLVALAPVACALAAAATARRWRPPWAATVTGLVYGFSPYVLGQAQGHLNLAWGAVLPPLVLGALWDLATGGRPWRVGVRLGLAAAFTLYVSSELVASTAVMAAVVLAVLACAHRRAVPRLARRLGVAALVAGAVAGLLAVPLLWAMATGPGRPSGSIRPVARFGNDLLDLVRPTRTEALPGSTVLPSHTQTLDLAEQGLGVGVLLVAAVVVVCCLCWRRPGLAVPTRVAATTAGAGWLLSLGSVLWAGGAGTALVLPWAAVAGLPLAEHVLPMRLSMFVWLGVSALVGLGLVRARQAAPSRRRTLGVAGLALALAPVWPAAAHDRPVTVPRFFTSAVARDIPAGAVVKTVPRPRAWASPHKAEAMAWQAVAGMRYRDTGGYFIGSSAQYPLIYESVADAYDLAYDAVQDGIPLPDPAGFEGREARRALLARGVEYVVIAPDYRYDDAQLAAWTARLVDSRARWVQGVWLVPVPRG